MKMRRAERCSPDGNAPTHREKFPTTHVSTGSQLEFSWTFWRLNMASRLLKAKDSRQAEA
jgi:hypothetical protein